MSGPQLIQAFWESRDPKVWNPPWVLDFMPERLQRQAGVEFKVERTSSVKQKDKRRLLQRQGSPSWEGLTAFIEV